MLYGTLGYGSRFQNEGSYAYFWTNTTETMNDSIPIAYIRKLNYMETECSAELHHLLQLLIMYVRLKNK